MPSASCPCRIGTLRTFTGCRLVDTRGYMSLDPTNAEDFAKKSTVVARIVTCLRLLLEVHIRPKYSRFSVYYASLTLKYASACSDVSCVKAGSNSSSRMEGGGFGIVIKGLCTLPSWSAVYRGPRESRNIRPEGCAEKAAVA